MQQQLIFEDHHKNMGLKYSPKKTWRPSTEFHPDYLLGKKYNI